MDNGVFIVICIDPVCGPQPAWFGDLTRSRRPAGQLASGSLAKRPLLEGGEAIACGNLDDKPLAKLAKGPESTLPPSQVRGG